jgi:hypothetical protein
MPNRGGTFHAFRVSLRPLDNCFDKFSEEPYAGRAAVPGRPVFRRALKARPTEFFLVLGKPAAQERSGGWASRRFYNIC